MTRLVSAGCPASYAACHGARTQLAIKLCSSFVANWSQRGFRYHLMAANADLAGISQSAKGRLRCSKQTTGIQGPQTSIRSSQTSSPKLSKRKTLATSLPLRGGLLFSYRSFGWQPLQRATATRSGLGHGSNFAGTCQSDMNLACTWGLEVSAMLGYIFEVRSAHQESTTWRT